jgi:hypothetical protein
VGPPEQSIIALLWFFRTLHLLGGHHIYPGETCPVSRPSLLQHHYCWKSECWTCGGGSQLRSWVQTPVSSFSSMNERGVGESHPLYLVPYTSNISSSSSALLRVLCCLVIGHKAVFRKHLFILFTLTTISFVLDNFIK